MDTDDILIIGAVAAVVLLTDNPLSRLLNKGGDTVDIANKGASEIVGGVGAPFEFVDTLFDKLSTVVKEGKQTTSQPLTGVSTNDYLASQGGVYGMTTQQIVRNIEKTAREQGNTKAVTPVYDALTGEGVNGAGYGYSSAFDLGSMGTGTNMKTYTNPSTGSTVKRGAGSFLTNIGFN